MTLTPLAPKEYRSRMLAVLSDVERTGDSEDVHMLTQAGMVRGFIDVQDDRWVVTALGERYRGGDDEPDTE